MNVGDTVIVADCGVEVEAIVLATSPYSAFPAMAGQEGTMYKVQSDKWFGNNTWVMQDKVRAVREKRLEFVLDKLAL